MKEDGLLKDKKEACRQASLYECSGIVGIGDFDQLLAEVFPSNKPKMPQVSARNLLLSFPHIEAVRFSPIRRAV